MIYSIELMQPPLLRPIFHDPPPPSDADITSGGSLMALDVRTDGAAGSSFSLASIERRAYVCVCGRKSWRPVSPLTGEWRCCGSEIFWIRISPSLSPIGSGLRAGFTLEPSPLPGASSTGNLNFWIHIKWIQVMKRHHEGSSSTKNESRIHPP